VPHTKNCRTHTFLYGPRHFAGSIFVWDTAIYRGGPIGSLEKIAVHHTKIAVPIHFCMEPGISPGQHLYGTRQFTEGVRPGRSSKLPCTIQKLPCPIHFFWAPYKNVWTRQFLYGHGIFSRDNIFAITASAAFLSSEENRPPDFGGILFFSVCVGQTRRSQAICWFLKNDFWGLSNDLAG
jgi:hypothetical protein